MSSILKSSQHARLSVIRSIPVGSVIAETERHNPDFEKIAKGTVIALEGQTFKVMSVSRYDEMNWKFTVQKKYKVFEWELFCLETGETRYLEWERDDGILAWISVAKLSNDPSSYGIVSWEEFLRNDRLDSKLTLLLTGKSLRYYDEESWAAKYFRDGTSDPAYAKFYEFSNGELDVCVEVWGKNGDEGVEVWTSKEIHPASVTLVARGE